MSDVYDSVLRRVRRTDGALYFMLEKLSSVRQLKRLEQVFKTDINIRDDKKAAERYRLILQSISDIEFKHLLFPHQELKGEFFLGYQVNDKERKRHAEAREQIRIRKAKKTIELWPLLPVGQSDTMSGSNIKFYFSNDPSVPGVRCSTFSETKKEMLEQLLHLLASVQDESVVDEIYNFLRHLDLRSGHDKEDFLEIVKRVTEEKFPLARAQKILDDLIKENLDKRFGGYERVRDELTKYFGNAVRDNLTDEQVSMIYNAISPILEASAEEFDFARAQILKVSTLAQARKSLLESISYSDSLGGFDRRETRLHRSYVRVGYVEGYFDRFKIEVSMSKQSRRSDQNEWLHEKFEALKQNIWGWLLVNPGYSIVALTMSATAEYNDEPFWTRGPVELK